MKMLLQKNSRPVFPIMLSLLIISSSTLADMCGVKKKELSEINQRQQELINKSDPNNSANLEEMLKEIDKENAKKIGMLSLMKLKDSYNKSREALENINAQEFLSKNAITFLNDLSGHIKAVAHHNLIINTMNSLDPQDANTNMPEAQSSMGNAVLTQNKYAGSWRKFYQSLGGGQASLYEYMQDCNNGNQKEITKHCEQFKANISKLESIGKKFGDPSFVSESKEVIDNYGKLIAISLDVKDKGKATNDLEFYETIAEHKAILRKVDLLGGADIFGLNRNSQDLNSGELEKIDGLLNFFESIHIGSSSNSAISNKIEFQLDSTINKDKQQLIESVQKIRTSLSNIKEKCDILNLTSCSEKITPESENGNTFAKELKELNEKFALSSIDTSDAQRNGVPHLDENSIFNPKLADVRKEYIDKLESTFTDAKIDSQSFESYLSKSNDPKLKTCRKLKSVFLGQEKLNDFITGDDEVKAVRDCQAGIASIDLDSKIKESEMKVLDLSKKVKKIVETPDFKNLEILKSLLYTDYFKNCTDQEETENLYLQSTCSDSLVDSHTKQIDILKENYREINDDVITRNYLRYLDINDRGSLFKDERQWASILRGQCGGFSEATAELSTSEEVCGFESSCHACKAVYNLGKDAIATKKSKELSNLPMHVYREYDPSTQRMVNKRHPIKSIVAHTMMYAARKIPEIGAPFIQWQQFRGSAIQMQYSALQSKQMFTWNQQYREQAYKAYDLTNPNLFNLYAQSRQGYSF